ncbi:MULTISPECIES: efflux RND transporter periplasmic adaptor subunit [Rhizobium/Agrobacterium group]|uniref:HlyD family secretion protein n=2 Tax=Rhizobium/Agrobacterium group TaxID=227290 RepID=B9K1M4_ALLAM|nr:MULTISPECIES: efflux RND transporter periplasmic adaptor subunit [Rhizobium/Agrobacterium group]ACM38772.1 HlyD family secretion protein [Allorhizobium ampelinum S4]MBF2713441.1 efflux RND transporter periplasmic adaptor subunit [Agrobacterium vitis]MCF1445940.1 efflux RND transporter periplasmic adaptor subunit [Allorhizobium ampelinum]MCF1481272.1 efflux RND transporter periplasmic adaptor subunit [Allorhizobium ampelinum]MUO26528.1 efflux RND transporter periplasmic adaptor subunit [Agro
MTMLKSLGRVAVTLVVVVAALFAGYHLWVYYMEEPWTRDGRVRADVAEIAPDVTGPVSEVLAKDNATVRKGDVLFKVDAKRFELALEQAQADLDQAKSSLDEAVRERQREERLGDSASAQARDKAVSAEEQAQASYNKALASRDVAKLDLDRTEVKSTVNGTVSNFSLQVGDFVNRGTATVAVVNTDTLRVEAYFEESKLQRIREGDRASVRIMGQKTVLTGRVESMATGIQDRERDSSSGLLVNITPTFNWVRLAQRVPVRIHLENVPEGTRLISGLTATVDIQPEAQAGQK